MIEVNKLFDLVSSNSSDLDIRKEIIEQLQEPLEFPALCQAGSKSVAASSAQMGFGFQGVNNDTIPKDSSLFMIALIKNKPLTASIILEKLGHGVLAKTNEKGENGFHAVAKFDNTDFRKWFFTNSCAVSRSVLVAEEFKSALNAVTPSDHNVFTLIPAHRLTTEELSYWFTLGALPQCPGLKAGNLLHLCCEKNKPELVRPLSLHYRELMVQRNDKGRLPVHVAAGLESSDCLKALIDAGSPLSVEDRLFNLPIHIAIVKGAVQSLKIILQTEPMVTVDSKKIPHVNVSNGNFESPLHLLIMFNKTYSENRFKEVLNVLMDYGADTTLHNSKNMTPLKLAREYLDEIKMTPDTFDILYKRIVENINTSLVCPGTLFEMIKASTSPAEAEQLILTLTSIFKLYPTLPDPYQLIQQNYIQELKLLAKTRYQDYPEAVQTFNLMLDELIKFHSQVCSQRQGTTQGISYQWAASSQVNGSVAKNPSSMNLYL